MIEDQPPIIKLEGDSPKNTFPIIAQLGILSFILVGIFGSLYYLGNQPEEEPVVTEQLPRPTTTYAPTPPQKLSEVPLQANAAYVWDVRGQRALYSKNAETALPLASITKLMTTLLAHELMADSQETAISLNAIRQEGSSGLVAGETLTIKELQELALISSSNDAAYALAASVGNLLGNQDPTAQFIAGMNIRADELKLETLEFSNTTGLDLSETVPGATGSARDVSFLMEYIITNYPELIAPTQQTSARVFNTAGAYHDINNTNLAVDKIPNMIGSKTGYTDLAGGNLTIAFDVGYNRPIVITVLGSTPDERFSDVLRLVEAVQQSITAKD